MRALSKAELSTIPAEEKQTVENYKLRDGPNGVASKPSDPELARCTVWRKLGIGPSGKEIEMGTPKTPQITSNTLGKRDHSIRRTWSGRLSWSARTFFFPGMKQADRETE